MRVFDKYGRQKMISLTGISGSWVDVRYYASFSAAIDAIGATEKTLLIPNEQAVSADKTVPANVTLKFLQGGSLNIATTKTLTINGHIEAGLYQIFKWSGTGVVTFGVGSVSELYPQYWGAKGDGSTDDTTAIQAAIDAMSAGDILLIPAGTYKITNVIFDPPNDCSLHCFGTLTKTGGTGVAFHIGDASPSATSKSRYSIYGLRLSSTAIDHTADRIGVAARNLNECYLDIRRVEGFEIGILFIGSAGEGCCYNETHLGRIVSNKYSIKMTAETIAAASGWCNENSFYGGHFSWDSGLDTTGFRHIWIDHFATHPLNNNKFYSPSFEGGKVATAPHGIYCEGPRTDFYSPRFEMIAGAQYEFTANATTCSAYRGNVLSIDSFIAPSNLTVIGRTDSYFGNPIRGGFGATSTAGTADWNDATNAHAGGANTLLYGDAANGPGGHVYYHSFCFEFSVKNGTGNMTQFAIPHTGTSSDNGIYVRSKYGAVWTAWMRVLSENTSGDVGIGTTSPTSKLHVVGLPIYANNAAAVAGGLTAGAFYRTGGDPDTVCVVH